MGFFNGLVRMFTLPKAKNSVRDVAGDQVADAIKPIVQPLLEETLTKALDNAFNSLYDTARLKGASDVVLDKLVSVYPGIKREFLNRCKI